MRYAKLVFAVCVLAGLLSREAEGQTYTCLPGTDSVAMLLRNYVVQLVTSTDSASVVHRNRYSLPTTTANKVTVETSANTCTTAGQKYHAAVRPPGTPAVARTLIVIKVSTTRYVVRDISEAAGEFTPTEVFDKNWVRLAGWDS